jgi:PIN domain nuclease of toxin-antitoxin system
LRLLLDSHVLLWFAQDAPVLSSEVVRSIRSEKSRAVVSVVSIWELEMKRAKGMLDAPADMGARLNPAGFDLLDVTLAHVVCAAELPVHHRDPFDRMLVAQAQTERLTLVTADSAIERYDVPIMAARA